MRQAGQAIDISVGECIDLNSLSMITALVHLHLQLHCVDISLLLLLLPRQTYSAVQGAIF
jgi:hypothetical protein